MVITLLWPDSNQHTYTHSPQLRPHRPSGKRRPWTRAYLRMPVKKKKRQMFELKHILMSPFVFNVFTATSPIKWRLFLFQVAMAWQSGLPEQQSSPPKEMLLKQHVSLRKGFIKNNPTDYCTLVLQRLQLTMSQLASFLQPFIDR